MTNRNFRLACSALAASLLCGCGGPEDRAALDGVIEIIHAIDAGDHRQLEALLERSVKPTPIGSPLSPLRAAITHFEGGRLYCDQQALELLLRHGANPNFLDPQSGFTALESATSMGEVGCMRALKAAGANPLERGKSGQSILGFAVKGAARAKSNDPLILVLSWGIDPNTRSAGGSTAFHEAVWNTAYGDSSQIIGELLARGADPCIADDRGQTPYDMAKNLRRPARNLGSLRAVSLECRHRSKRPTGR